MKKLILLAAMLATALAGAAPAHAQGVAAEQYAGGSATPPGAAEQYAGDAPPGASNLVVVGTVTDISGSVVLVEEDPSSEAGDKGFFTATEETAIFKQQGEEWVSAIFEELEVGQRVEATYAGDVAASDPPQGNAASIAILEDVDCPFPGGCNGSEPPPEDTATLSFELTVEGEPPAGTTFSGVTSIESFVTAPLADPDGDGLYAGSLTVPRTSGGQGGPPEPLSLPVRIVQDGATVVKDFGLVRIDGDKIFQASISFDGSEPPPPEEEVTVTGILERLDAEPVVVDGIEICGPSTHAITDEATGRYYDLSGDSVDLDEYVGERVAATGTPLASPAIEEAEPCPDLDVTRVELLDGGTEPPPPLGRSATLAFELFVECEPPEGAAFFGNVQTGEGGPGIFAQLLDPDGDGLYVGVATLPDRFAPGPAPEGTPPVSLPVRIVQGTGTRSVPAGTLPGEPTSVVRDFGAVPMEAENVFPADASFCDGDGGSNDDGNGGGNAPDPVVSGDGNDHDGGGEAPGGGTSDGVASGSGGSDGGAFGGIKTLSATGGALLVAGLAGVALVAGGVLARRITR